MGITLVIADDHQIVRDGLCTMFRNEPEFDVVGEAADGRTTVELAEKLRPDVVIMDVSMPELNGVEATRQIRARNPGVRVVALSMHPERQFVSEMLAAGASGYLLKDSPFGELATAVRTAAAGQVYLCPRVAAVVVKGYVGGDTGGAPKTGPFYGNLSPREREVLQLLAEGKNTKEIAFTLHVSTKTIETHRRQVMEKLNIYSVAELTRYAIREGVTAL
jgi:DNA-binding NarL/FixJ family response regulator